MQFPSSQNIEKFKQRTEQIRQALSQMQQQFTNLDGPGRIQALSKFGADFFIPGKIIGACGHLLGGLYSGAKNVCSFERIASMLPEQLRAAQMIEKIEERVGKQILQEFMEAESSYDKAKNGIKSEGPAVSTAKAFPNRM